GAHRRDRRLCAWGRLAVDQRARPRAPRCPHARIGARRRETTAILERLHQPKHQGLLRAACKGTPRVGRLRSRWKVRRWSRARQERAREEYTSVAQDRMTSATPVAAARAAAG